MTRIGIVDPCCTSGYAPSSLAAGGLGGTEATVLRVAGALSHRFDVEHFQNGRTPSVSSPVGRLFPLAAAYGPVVPGTLVVINSWKVAVKLRRAHPAARIVLWLHVNPGRHNRAMGAALAEAGIAIVCVSDSQARRLRDFLSGGPVPDIRYIHNPVADGLLPDATPRNHDRLLFASSPHKGLREVYAQFAVARAAIPSLTLAVADPGYLAWDSGPVPDGVTLLGALPHAALIAELRRCLCLFYPQTTFAETFGLVLAEANAVGTPVLVHGRAGANAEIVADADQRVDGRDPAQILDRLTAWRDRFPQVSGDRRFGLNSIAQAWTALLAPVAVPHREAAE